MAGIGVKLNKIYDKKSLVAHISGFAYSTVSTVAPMILVIIAVVILGKLIGFDSLRYSDRELFSVTILYIFIFGLLSAAPFNSVLSKYMSDVIYEEKYDDIMPCFYTGLLINIVFAMMFAIPFLIHETKVGGVDILFVFLSMIGFVSMVFVFYTMLYLSICKDYSKITLFYFIGMLAMVIVGVVSVNVFGAPVTYTMLLSLDIGLTIIGILEYAQLQSYFTENSGNYKKPLPYFKTYWPLIFSNFLYVAGLYVHNFVFWTTDLKLEVANTFICAEPYDMATFLALITNLTSTVIFISNVELRFHGRYKRYAEAITGGRLDDIELAKDRMFYQLSSELMSIVRIQFIISVVLFLIFSVVLPMIGVSGLVMQIYPALAVGYFILFIMYAEIIFLYYYNDLKGALCTSASFFVTTLVASMWSSHLNCIWYGTGLVIGAFVGWTVGYARLRWVEKHADEHIFCRGVLIKRGREEKPSDLVYKKSAETN